MASLRFFSGKLQRSSKYALWLLLIFSLFIVIACCIFDKNDCVDGFCVEIVQNKIAILNYCGNEKKIIIPDLLLGRPVVGIYYNAFRNKYIQRIAFPKYLEFIADRAFMYNDLREVIIPETVRIIGYGVFENNQINHIILSPNITSIEMRAFANNEIAELKLAENLTWIAQYAFEDNRLTELSIPSGVGIRWGAFLGNNIAQINVGENVRLYPIESIPVFELGFDDFYLENDGRAGTYTFENGEWGFALSPEI